MKKMLECNQEERKKTCACTYDCSRRGKGCGGLENHLTKNQLPRCVFAKISNETERSYNRNFDYFAKLVINR